MQVDCALDERSRVGRTSNAFRAGAMDRSSVVCAVERPTPAQGGSFAYLTPAFAIIAQVKARGAWVDAADGTNHARFLVRTHNIKALTMHNIATAQWPVLGPKQSGQAHTNAQTQCMQRTAPTTRTSWCRPDVVLACLHLSHRGS